MEDLTRTKPGKSILRIAHPPPRSKHQQRLHLPPKRLLQLQLLSDAGRPTPYLDVCPATNHAIKVPHRLLKQLKRESGLGSGDFAVLRSNLLETTSRQDQEEGKHIVAIGHFAAEKGLPEQASICMETGLVWTVRQLRSGSYEFEALDKLGGRQIARWVPKRDSSGDDSIDKSLVSDHFTFSLVDPNERRHAVLANLRPEGIEICNHYRRPRSSSQSSDTPSAAEDGERARRDTVTMMTEDLKLFIVASGVLVGLSEGFSPIYTPRWKQNGGKGRSATGIGRSEPQIAEAPSLRAPNETFADSLPIRERKSVALTSTLPPPLSQDQVDKIPQRSLSMSQNTTQRKRFSGFDRSKGKSSGIPGHGNDIKENGNMQRSGKDKTDSDDINVKSSTAKDGGRKERRFSHVFKGWQRSCQV